MITLTNTKLVSGGNAAIAASVAVVTGVAAVGTSIEKFNEWGRDLGEAIYDKTHPDNNLGKMIYTKDDYTPEYLNYRHPNNNFSDNFHNSFGGF